LKNIQYILKVQNPSLPYLEKVSQKTLTPKPTNITALGADLWTRNSSTRWKRGYYREHLTGTTKTSWRRKSMGWRTTYVE